MRAVQASRAKQTMPPKGAPSMTQPDVFLRMGYLHQAAHLVHGVSPTLARFYTHIMRTLSQKAVLRLCVRVRWWLVVDG